MAAGGVAGAIANALWGNSEGLKRVLTYGADPAGQIFLRLLLMMVLPLIFTSIVLAVAGFRKPHELVRAGGKTLGLFVVITALGAMLGVGSFRLMSSAHAVDFSQRQELRAAYASGTQPEKTSGKENAGIDTLVGLIPANIFDAAARGDLPGIMLFALVFGGALARLSSQVKEPVIKVLEGASRAIESMIGFAMYLAPVGVGALMFGTTARLGGQVLRSLGFYLVVVYASLAIFEFIVLGALVWWMAGITPSAFFRRGWLPVMTAFVTASSSATLPTTMNVAEEEFGISREVVQFVLPLSATLSRGGSALYAVVTVLFLAQVFGVPINSSMSVWLALLGTITALGVAGIPAGAVPLLTFLLSAAGVPGSAIGLVLGVEQITGMARTVPNVSGGLLAALVIGRGEAGRFESKSKLGGRSDIQTSV